ncbi:hypothetical protein DTO006G1_5785 [Penicillium roqueforti]|uniref:uncharacterized protein n=1 Tax=Penicillium roqueforti TaxID=5082 RepID=UPI0019092FE1|nr:uncharacterized protein LCP9604111_2885 [Penicillium roqueforti]KAF9250681.1 hypothetical protein LCP9604111_2885 [Penicillium roqueforti]KAI1836829.1 hypothetical protein CBS147337_2081 [Penicillium roqueforti]KAI2677887.1 hypothetical protein CBS147355_4888 [Penicillium roqueforti]KAI2686762.1 hypothetical protein LCP963914a_4362 [Penicillium roqueforti]KAI2704251.1 hypothetical protein CBS147372_2720 [Penicillium roqueforti]
MASLFSKRLTCFYCGQRSARSHHGPVCNFRCEHCEADNFFDEKGEITDPPAVVTNAYAPGASDSPFESTDFGGSQLFCAKCTRNQHLFTSSLASYFPPSDDPTDSEYERGYEQFRRSLEDRYPQVCESCEPIVKSRIRRAGYEAKSDHLRRMMDQSRANRESRQARNRSWRSLLLLAGALAYWASIAGQIVWNLISVATLYQPSPSFDYLPETERPPMAPNSVISCVNQSIRSQRIPSECSPDLAPTAGLALIAGAFSLWWNPKLRMKIDGMPGKFRGLAEYYQAQLIVMVVRCVFWAVVKDPSASGLEPKLIPAFHALMMVFTILSVLFSRYVVSYSSRPLVNWSDNSWETQFESPKASSSVLPESPMSTRITRSGGTPKANIGGFQQRFPIDKLAQAQAQSPSPVEQPLMVAPNLTDNDGMDWSPSITHNLRPTVTRRDQPSVLDGPHPFQGQIPAAPMPPAWKLRTQTSTKPIEQVIQPNPFHRSPIQPQGQWQQKHADAEPVFKEPKFFPPHDHDTSTGLETLFDRAFNLQPDAAQGPGWSQQPRNKGSRVDATQNQLFYGCLRLGLLVSFISAWTISQNHQVLIPGNYVEIAALGVASLVAGFALITMVKRPLAQWNGMEILISITELGVAVHMGAHLPTVSLNRDYFDRYGKLLLVFMAAQESMNVLSFYNKAKSESRQHSESVSPQPQPQSPRQSQLGALDWSASQSSSKSTPEPRASSPPVHRSFESQLPVPPLSFGDTEAASSFSSALPSVPQYGLAASRNVHSFPPTNQSVFNKNRNPHSFTMESLKQIEPVSDYERDSDTETIATTTTTATNFTNRNIRYGNDPGLGSSAFYSPRRNGLGSGMGGLSLDDDPTPRRMTRSQTQRGLLGRRPTNYVR